MRTHLFVAALLISGCASRPQLYPNKKLQEAGREAAERDVESCERLADQYMTSGKGKDIAAGAGKGAVIGGVTGAVAGIFSGNAGRGALFGAAVGGTAGGTGAAVSPDQVKRNFMNQCLEEKGYKVVGWR
ncbi:MAG: cell envelope biogenesis protein OmpA [Bdellovibrionales bacterium]|nr:cell envelope biogenesis protein OmpA [Bdellovibrionales bacterium]